MSRDIKEVWDRAREKMTGFCRVCRICDGKACAGEVPGMGGLGSGASFQNNIAALKNYSLKMRVIHSVTEPETSVEIMGFHLKMPVLAAPIGGTSYNMGEKSISEEKYIMSLVEGCKKAGTIGCTGDGPLDYIFEDALEAIKRVDGWAIPFIKPWEEKKAKQKIEAAAEAGCQIIGMDIDAIGLITLKKMGKPVEAKSVAQLEDLAAYVHSLDRKFIVKGIMTPEDALFAMDAGADGIVVSNHGGRVLDCTPGTASALAVVASLGKGKITIFVDGGIRSGTDVLKMLALGADAVLIGRPCSIAVVGDPEDGIVVYLDMIRSQLASAMVLTGTSNLRRVDVSILGDL